MAKVTSKLQITIPKKIAGQYGIKLGDDIEFVAGAGGIRLVPAGAVSKPTLSPEERVRLFDESTAYADRRAQELGVKPVEDESVRDGGVRVVDPFLAAADAVHELPCMYVQNERLLPPETLRLIRRIAVDLISAARPHRESGD